MYFPYHSVNLIKIDLPICDSNKPNGVIPKKVEELDNKLKESDALVFSIPEYTGCINPAITYFACQFRFFLGNSMWVIKRP